MDVRYIATTSDKLSELAIVNGQLIYLSDVNATYYDMGNSRRLISSMRVVSSLPSTSVAQQGVIYGLVNGAGRVDASVWDASASTFRQMTGYVATASSLGLVRPDGTTITIDANGVISCHSPVTELPADQITYDNTTSALAATNAQVAIDEVNTTATGASASASSAIASASSAINAANAASSLAASASTAATSALELIAQATTAIAALETRLQAVEAVASVALIDES